MDKQGTEKHSLLWACISDAIEEEMSHREHGVMSFFALFYRLLQKCIDQDEDSRLFGEIYMQEPQWDKLTEKVASIVISQSNLESPKSKESSSLKDKLKKAGAELQGKCGALKNCLSEEKPLEGDLLACVNAYLTAYLKLCQIVTTFNLECQEILDRDSIRFSFMSGYEGNSSLGGNGDKNDNGDNGGNGGNGGNKSDGEVGCIYRFYSPSIIENCVVIGRIIDEYRDDLSAMTPEEAKIKKEMFVSLLKEKAERLFFINTIIDNCVYVTSIDKESKKVPYRCERLENRSSVESIEMIRLIEKIDAYMEDRRYMIDAGKVENANKIHILLMSYVDLCGGTGLETLNSYLETKYCKDGSNLSFQFHIYYNSRDVRCKVYENLTESNWEPISGTFLERKQIQLSGKNKAPNVTLYKDNVKEFGNDDIPVYMNQLSLNYFLGKGEEDLKIDIVFVLDTPAMYRKGVEIRKSHSIELYTEWLNKVITGKGYIKELPGKYFNFNEDFFHPVNKLPIKRVMARYNMIALGLTDREGSFEYKLKEEIIKLFISRIQEARKEQELLHIHVMLSSSHSVNNTNYAKWNLVREERYRGKKFCLFTFKSPTNRGGRLSLSKGEDEKWRFNKNYICFSLWNVYKHIDLTWLTETKSEIRNIILQNSNDASELIRAAKSFYIHLQWAYDCHNKTARYFVNCVEKKGNSSEIKSIAGMQGMSNFVRVLFSEILTADNNYEKSLTLCFQNALLNAMYSRIRCLEDAVNFQMMKIHFKNGYKTQVFIVDDHAGNEEMNREIDVIENVPSALLPDRWAFIRALDTLSSPMTEIEFYYMLHELETINGIDPNEFLGNVVAICQHSDYTGSRLYAQAKTAWENI